MAHKRLLEIDILRSLAIVAIILAHLDYFSGGSADWQSGDRIVFLASTALALFGLSAFFFLSGYSLYLNNNELENGQQLARFFRKRWTRIYPLYWLGIASIVVLFVAPINQMDYAVNPLEQSPIEKVATIVGAQAYIAKGYTEEMTLWFVSVILGYYLIFGALVRCGNGIRKLVPLSFVIFGIMLFIRLVYDSVDIRFYIYYWFFIGGVAAARLGNVFAVGSRRMLYSLMILGATTLAVYVLVYRSLTAPGLFRMFVVYDSLGLLLLSSSIIVVSNLKEHLSAIVRDFIERISFSTYSIFIFHLPILSFLAFLASSLDIEGLARFLAILLVGVPLSIVVSYYVQVADSYLRVRFFKIQDLAWSQPKREKKRV